MRVRLVSVCVIAAMWCTACAVSTSEGGENATTEVDTLELTAHGIGDARLGMDFVELSAALGPEFTVDRGDSRSSRVLLGDELIFRAFKEDGIYLLFRVTSPLVVTAGGVRTGLTIAEAETLVGAASASAIGGSESVRFERLDGFLTSAVLPDGSSVGTYDQPTSGFELVDAVSIDTSGEITAITIQCSVVEPGESSNLPSEFRCDYAKNQ